MSLRFPKLEICDASRQPEFPVLFIKNPSSVVDFFMEGLGLQFSVQVSSDNNCLALTEMSFDALSPLKNWLTIPFEHLIVLCTG